jgi:hypothetical protein
MYGSHGCWNDVHILVVEILDVIWIQIYFLFNFEDTACWQETLTFISTDVWPSDRT